MTVSGEVTGNEESASESVIGGFDFTDQTVLVAGFGISGRSVDAVLKQHGVTVISVDEHNDAATRSSFEDLPWDKITLVITSPGFPPSSDFLRTAQSLNIPIWSEIEFAWRTRAIARESGTPAPWIGITGTNGKTTTTEMTAAILADAGRKVPAVGNIGEPVSKAVQDSSNDGFCVELSSFALHYTESLHLEVAIWTNVAADHLDWHGGFDNYAADKAKVFTNARRALVYNADDSVVSEYASRAVTEPGCVKVGFTLGQPQVGQIGVVDGWMVDHSDLSKKIADVDGGLLVSLASLKNLSEPDGTVYPHLLADCMAATAACLAFGVPLADIRKALSSFKLDAHRIECVETYVPDKGAAPIRFIDDSKATNAHAATASLSSFRDNSVVWIAGGLAKGARFEDLISQQAHVMKAAVLIGLDQEPFVEALAAHAPNVPVYRVSGEKNGDSAAVMQEAVDAAMTFAHEGDVVLMAPATASMDQFVSYADRGNKFAQAAHSWVSRHA